MKILQKMLTTFVLCLVLTISCSVSAKTKPWTFLVYLAAANNLNEFAYGDIAEMMKVGSNENINIIVYLTLVQDDGSKITTRLYVENGALIHCGEPTVEDSGDVRSLMNALEWSFTDYPSEHTAVVLWNHGSGALNRSQKLMLRGICYDDDMQHYLTDRDCVQAFSWAQRRFNGGKKFDIIACDACLMGMLEVAYAFSGCADYFVASQETIPGNGYEYARVLDEFMDHVPTPRELAKSLVSAYYEEYEGTPDFTLSAIDMSEFQPLVTNINQLADVLLDGLKGKKRSHVKKYIGKSLKKTDSFDDGTYIDMGGFYSRLHHYRKKMRLSKKDRSRLKRIIKKGHKLLDRCVIAKVASASYKDLSGLSMYFPQHMIDDSYYDLYWTERNPALLHMFEGYLQTKHLRSMPRFLMLEEQF